MRRGVPCGEENILHTLEEEHHANTEPNRERSGRRIDSTPTLKHVRPSLEGYEPAGFASFTRTAVPEGISSVPRHRDGVSRLKGPEHFRERAGRKTGLDVDPFGLSVAHPDDERAVRGARDAAARHEQATAPADGPATAPGKTCPARSSAVAFVTSSSTAIVRVLTSTACAMRATVPRERPAGVCGHGERPPVAPLSSRRRRRPRGPARRAAVGRSRRAEPSASPRLARCSARRARRDARCAR